MIIFKCNLELCKLLLWSFIKDLIFELQARKEAEYTCLDSVFLFIIDFVKRMMSYCWWLWFINTIFLKTYKILWVFMIINLLKQRISYHTDTILVMICIQPGSIRGKKLNSYLRLWHYKSFRFLLLFLKIYIQCCYECTI